MEAPALPRWFAEELASRHPNIRLMWMPWREPRDSMRPILGVPMSRMRTKAGRLYYRYRIPGLEYESSVEWFPVDDAAFAPSHRYSVQQKTLHGRWEKLFDCVTDDGALVPVSREVLNAIDARDDKHGAWQEVIDLIDSDDAYHQDEDGTYLTKVEKLARDDAEEAARDDFARLARKLGPTKEVFVPMYDPPPRSKDPHGFFVLDKRRFR